MRKLSYLTIDSRGNWAITTASESSAKPEPPPAGVSHTHSIGLVRHGDIYWGEPVTYTPTSNTAGGGRCPRGAVVVAAVCGALAWTPGVVAIVGWAQHWNVYTNLMNTLGCVILWLVLLAATSE